MFSPSSGGRMGGESNHLIVVFNQDTVLSDANNRDGSFCSKVGVPKGAYYAERIPNPLNGKLQSWLVLAGTRIGIIERVLLNYGEAWVTEREAVFLFEPGQVEVENLGHSCKRPKDDDVKLFDLESMGKKVKQRPRQHKGEPEHEPEDDEMYV